MKLADLPKPRYVVECKMSDQNELENFKVISRD